MPEVLYPCISFFRVKTNLLLWIGPLMYNAIPIGYCWAIFMIVCFISMGVMLFMVKWLERVAK
ncbi:hypothetical protein BACCOP_00016 [Phocaeicola coprocola DSM 17136]|uniref:Uncharacterized protein n=1 Tax=Phocaeicola coprocola DSM 17136 TaxID=470145 RepID=B3JDT0_9BACT|nr:hypothetical protein BACCOP_00016 [Phocaeicola coprocola DSM 17136]